jgi:bifunctional DNA-binding transcriptional regulator/antitoxin component of YhaV-PrlF toxin-antitoxin module
MNYKVKLSSKNQITLPVDLLKNIQVRSGDVLTMSLKNSQVIIESLSSVKNNAIKHLSIINPYNLSKEKINFLKINPKGHKDMAIARYEKYLKSIKKTKNES